PSEMMGFVSRKGAKPQSNQSFFAALRLCVRCLVDFFMSLPNDPFERMAALLQMESQAQAWQTLERVRRLTAVEAERGGDCLLGLVARDESAGLGGRFVLTLAKRGGAPLPWTRLQPGSPVLLSLQGRAH